MLILSACGQAQGGIASHPVVDEKAYHEVYLEAQYTQERVKGEHVVLSDALA